MHPALEPLARAMAALTYDEIDVIAAGMGITLSNEEVTLLDRSIGHDLIRLEAAISAKGLTLLSAIAASIDEALTSIEEARRPLQPGDSDHG